jgi:hypothetical protein
MKYDTKCGLHMMPAVSKRNFVNEVTVSTWYPVQVICFGSECPSIQAFPALKCHMNTFCKKDLRNSTVFLCISSID